MKKFLRIAALVAVLSLFLVGSAFAQGELPADPVGAFQDLFVAVAAAIGVGALITVLLQIGKLVVPKWFPDNSADNWRLGIVLIVAIVLYFGPQFGLVITFADLDVAAQSLSELGVMLMPLFIWLADWVSRTFYQKVLRNKLWFVGKSTTITRKRAAGIAKKKKLRAAS